MARNLPHSTSTFCFKVHFTVTPLLLYKKIHSHSLPNPSRPSRRRENDGTIVSLTPFHSVDEGIGRKIEEWASQYIDPL
jgi:hypothetical protein